MCLNSHLTEFAVPLSLVDFLNDFSLKAGSRVSTTDSSTHCASERETSLLEVQLQLENRMGDDLRWMPLRSKKEEVFTFPI